MRLFIVFEDASIIILRLALGGRPVGVGVLLWKGDTVVCGASNLMLGLTGRTSLGGSGLLGTI